MAFANETETPTPSTPALLGPEAIRAALKTMPLKPGVYRMIGAGGEILYIGKAKHLKNRVSNYANTGQLTTRIMKMVEQVARVDITVTGSEAEALLIEASLVKRHNPRYNILLKDDKSFPHLLLSGHPYPRLAKHRGAQKDKGEYYGPFASVGALNQTVTMLQKIFLLRNCEDSVFKNRTRPCLQYQIKRCTAPCVGYVTEQQYETQVVRARDFLRGKHRDLQEELAADMQRASDDMEFERAAVLRDRIQVLTRVQQEQAMRPRSLNNADVIVLVRRGGRSLVQLFLFREGAHFGHQTFHPKHDGDATDAEVMASFLGLFYQNHLPAPELLVNIAPAEPELLEEALKLRAGYAVSIAAPQRGDKRLFIENAQTNAMAALDREEQQHASIAQHLAGVAGLFCLSKPPQKIEVYDNSHIGGRHALGAMIVATPEGFDKRCYRTFNMDNIEPGDDYAMMRAMLERRFKRVADGDGWAAPDLLLIDGGKGQLSAALEAFENLRAQGSALERPALVAIAKGEDRNAGREWFFMPGREPFQLPVNDPTLHYLQRLRDEAHRFAIGTHRNKRSKSLTTSGLDDIPGIGSARKKALLHHFGSRAAVERATLAELEKVAGISRSTARTIHDYFHG